MISNVKYLSFILLLVLTACKSGPAASQEQNGKQDTVKVFNLPDIPVVLNTVSQRADYMVKHYWDRFDFTDTTYVSQIDVAEQAWVDYCDLLEHVPLSDAQTAIKETIGRAGKNKKMLDFFAELADKYLYDPNSPMRNEELYIPVLEALTASPMLNETEKIRPQARLELAQKNRLGTKALNFTYTLDSGAKGTLYQFPAEYTLLFINNPGCHACSEMIEGLKSSPVINGFIAGKKLRVLSLYPDEELDEWKKHRGDFAKEWTNGYDKELVIKNKNLYDLRAIPTLYLLDKNKTVLLKDATLQKVEQYLAERG
ncbi:DUF5106 domain-containing protein [Bacteroides fragilis]|uniref:DUF5106 domain-containing protein n=2 Tax=Bacteroides fragilis TaxID=817 RepID=A0AAP9SVD6_BACFG|nr:DUF5106 domain-containing protein [Bacteroides fragilis]EFR52225.1 hypothetical protein BFAG_00919 [Bacteroides fragilis 3_1_12]MBM6510609.1 DUF5106 domain-containing protein [Bacteroides fragilis]OCL16621.1 lipofamily protein [Bacteroides fragilis]OCM98934.1 lipofamily protein [Bacteroides fragilis]QKH84345.1 DUF5106 domain-containing protein [Bacteroides fragilis]